MTCDVFRATNDIIGNINPTVRTQTMTKINLQTAPIDIFFAAINNHKLFM